MEAELLLAEDRGGQGERGGGGVCLQGLSSHMPRVNETSTY